MVAAVARIVALSTADYRRVLSRTAELGLAGGVIYDGLIARVAEKHAVDRLLTFHVEDFRRVWPEGASIVTAP